MDEMRSTYGTLYGVGIIYPPTPLQFFLFFFYFLVELNDVPRDCRLLLLLPNAVEAAIKTMLVWTKTKLKLE